MISQERAKYSRISYAYRTIEREYDREFLKQYDIKYKRADFPIDSANTLRVTYDSSGYPQKDVSQMLKRKEPPVQVKLQSRERTAAQCNVNIRTIDKMIERGELQSVRLGRRVMISVGSVNALLGER